MFTPRLFKIKMHTRRVLIFKRGLPVFSFLLAVLMLMWPMLWAEHKDQFSLAVSSGKEMTDAKINMEQVRFFAQDKKKQPLTIISPRVLETDRNNQIITLYKPIATYKMQSGEEIKAETPYGLVNQNNQTVVLEDTVVATTDTGYKAMTKNVVCDNKIGIITGHSPITIDGPAGKTRAQGFRLSDKGNQIDFLKKTDTTLYTRDGSVRIESADGLLINRPNQTITAEKDVRVTQNDRIITADKMVLDYLTKDQNPDTRIRQIEAFNHVVATSGTYRVTGDHGIYDPLRDMITVTGNVVLYQGTSHLNGEKATLNLKTGESHLLSPKGSATPSGRVKGTLIPAEMKGLRK
ncbi:MAG: LPS export ABC transporter periplasmic protein LptC [Pseudomonadota bacterium]|nr:LPS export ABC transporter periplasmic protein LptC [Pseudomonadota bacterium]